MLLWEYFDARARRFGIVDLKLAQAAAFFLALILAKVFPELLSLSVWWYVAICVACAIKPVIDFYRPRPAASPCAARRG
jgi:hypothetical protein